MIFTPIALNVTKLMLDIEIAAEVYFGNITAMTKEELYTSIQIIANSMDSNKIQKHRVFN